MAAKEQRQCVKNSSNQKRKRFVLGADVDKEEIFDYYYLTNDETISFIKEHGRVMIIIRGPNSTLKATLSEMIMTLYPTAQHCCADHYFRKTFSPPDRNRDTLKLAHNYCQKKVETACLKNENPIIVQNTHMRKREFQIYLDLAAVYNYTVIMAITLYKFDVTPEALARINPDGLNISYFRNRLRQWEDIPPLFTGWFLSPNDSIFILKSLQTTLSALLSDGKFCRVFDSYENNDIWDYFDGRRNLYCIAGYTENKNYMKDYYLSDKVQESYGKSYTITILGYLITKSAVMGIVHFDEDISHLTLKIESNYDDNLVEKLSAANLNDSINEYQATIPLPCDSDASEKSIMFENWQSEATDLKNGKLIHVAQQKKELFDIRAIGNEYFETLNSLTNDIEYRQLEDINVCRLPDDKWLVELSKKIKVKTLFTGLYI